MSGNGTLLQGTHYIHLILPSIKIYYKLDALLSSLLSTKNNGENLIVIGVEHINRKRHFLSLTFADLSQLIHYVEPSKRTFYEILCQNHSCKLYFDLDVYTEKSLSFNMEESLSILQCLFHGIISNCTDQSRQNSTTIEDHFLVLSASTELKHSYHLIYTNTCIRFESQQTIFYFIKLVLYHCLFFILTHKCHQQFVQSMNIHTDDNLNIFFERLQIILNHTNLCECKIPATDITCKNFQKLLVKNSNGIYQWIFDLQVYTKNQQIRLYKATKFGKNNPLILSTYFPFNQQHNAQMNNMVNDEYILNHSLISYITNDTNFLIFSLKENRWLLVNQNENNMIDLNNTNYFKSLIMPKTSSFKSTATQIPTTISTMDISNKENDYEYFISKLITQIYHSNGYIQSRQPGTKNSSLIFYNIGGNFRYCERLERHHQSNGTCIIIDTCTNKYQIKCKDPDCRNFKPSWKNIF